MTSDLPKNVWSQGLVWKLDKGVKWMPKVYYSKQEKEHVRQKLLESGLSLFSKQGYKATTLAEILQQVGISKPFFYTFYPSKEELVLNIMLYQQEILYKLLEKDMSKKNLSWKERIEKFLERYLYSRRNGLFIMSQAEEMEVFRHLGKEHYQQFQQEQKKFYGKLLERAELSAQRISPTVFYNLLHEILLCRNSAEQSMPFLFKEDVESAARIQLKWLAAYLEERHE